MTFTQSIKTCFTKYVDFSGRASRSEYWWWLLFLHLSLVLLFVLIIISGFADLLPLAFVAGALFLLFFLGALLPSITVWVRRFHDVNLSGWWIFAFLLFIFIVSIIFGMGLFYQIQELLMYEGAPAEIPYTLFSLFYSNLFVFVSLFVIPNAIFSLMLIFTIKEGDIGDNRFGSDPLAELDVTQP